VGRWRATLRAPARGARAPVRGADPLNLAGIVVPAPKVPALTGNRSVYRDGAAVAALVAGDVQWIEKLEPGEARAAEDVLIRRHPGSPLLAYLR
jgi:ATP-dependent Lhr-like helicase